MSIVLLYALVGMGLFTLGLYALIMHAHLLRKILAINIIRLPRDSRFRISRFYIALNFRTQLNTDRNLTSL